MKKIKLKFPENGSTVSLANDEQINFLKTDRTRVLGEKINFLNLDKSGEDKSFPLSVRFMWESDRISHLLISEHENFKASREIRADNCALISNLKCGTKYFWKVKNFFHESEVFTFTTENVFPRFISIEGDTNVRDIGGWTGELGTLKQGKIYRGSEFNSHLTLTKEGQRVLKEDLKIKSVLDLRGNSEVRKNVYGERYLNVPVLPYGDYIKDNPEKNRRIFKFLCEEKNYPMYIHCWGGADRTGTLVFLINALLGVDIPDLIDDYEITSLSVWGARSRNTELFKSLIFALNEFEGNTIREKAENYVLSTGVEQRLIEKLRRLMIK